MQELNISYFAIPGVERKCLYNAAMIINRVCEYFGVEKRQLLAKGRMRHNVTPRHIAMYLIRTKTTQSLFEIGMIFNRDHTTVINAMSKIRGFLYIQDESTIKAIETISNKLVVNN